MASKLLALEPLAKQRLFAVVHMFGRQNIVTDGDLIAVESHFPVKCGQKILLNKCVALGGRDFSLIGRPLIDKSIFKIEATIVEQTMTDHRCFYRHTPRCGGKKKYFFQSLPRTILRINKIELKKLPEEE